jgi:uncharacterized lipoprotein YbaY
MAPLLTLFFVGMVAEAARPPCASDRPIEIHGRISYVGLDALPWESVIRIYLEGVSGNSSGTFLTEKLIVTHGEQVPILFSWTIPDHMMRPDHEYRLCANIAIGGRVVFGCGRAVTWRGEAVPKHVELRLERVP